MVTDYRIEADRRDLMTAYVEQSGLRDMTPMERALYEALKAAEEELQVSRRRAYLEGKSDRRWEEHNGDFAPNPYPRKGYEVPDGESQLDPMPWVTHNGIRRAGNGYGTWQANDTGHNLWWNPREGYAQDIEDYR